MWKEFGTVRTISGLRLLYKSHTVIIRKVQATFTAVILGKTVIVEIGSVKHTGKLLGMYSVSHY